jgi:hypothetical protein
MTCHWRLLHVCALSLGVAVASQAQGVDGLILDIRGKPVPNIAVTLVDSTVTPVALAHTDSAGAFYLDAPAPGRYRLGFTNDSTALGQTMRFTLGANEFVQRKFYVEPVEHPFLLDFQVTRRAATVDSHLPLRAQVPPSRERGPVTVVVQFVVDTTGRADMSTWRAIAGTSAQFAAGLRSSIRDAEFRPALVAGAAGERKVRQLVEYTFSLSQP